MSQLSALNFKAWIDEHRSMLKPPVGLVPIWTDRQFMVSVVGGPNERKDYHINPTEEFFYQIEGDMTLKIIEDNERRDVTIAEGAILLLPPLVPHSPQRPAKSVGLLIEHQRPVGQNDHVRFYCDACDHIIFDESVYMTDLSLLKPILERFWGDQSARTCEKCSAVLEPPPKAS
jgi:3-hydroxyanthranilate 3,4-dioxygenase